MKSFIFMFIIFSTSIYSSDRCSVQLLVRDVQYDVSIEKNTKVGKFISPKNYKYYGFIRRKFFKKNKLNEVLANSDLILEISQALTMITWGWRQEVGLELREGKSGHVIRSVEMIGHHRESFKELLKRAVRDLNNFVPPNCF